MSQGTYNYWEGVVGGLLGIWYLEHRRRKQSKHMLKIKGNNYVRDTPPIISYYPKF